MYSHLQQYSLISVDYLNKHWKLQVGQTHVETVSMGVLFLMEACRKADEIFGLKRQSTSHTVRDTNKY